MTTKTSTLILGDMYFDNVSCEVDQEGKVSQILNAGTKLSSENVVAITNSEMEAVAADLNENGIIVSSYEGWYSEDGEDYLGEFTIDLDTLKSAVETGRIIIRHVPSGTSTIEHFKVDSGK